MTKPKKVEWNWNDFKPLDWTLDELDDFLKSKSTELTSPEMATLMIFIFPEPNGTPDSSNRLKAGSIPLKEQMRLCMKYVKPEDQPTVFAGFWATYRNSNALEDYRRDVLEQIPIGDSRTRAITDYYANRFRDYSDIKNFLASEELTDLMPRNPETRIDSTLSDYTGVVYAIGGTLRALLEQENASAEEIIATLKASRLDEKNRIRLIQSIETRSKEIESMRK